jgi:hypothetical protein
MVRRLRPFTVTPSMISGKAADAAVTVLAVSSSAVLISPVSRSAFSGVTMSHSSTAIPPEKPLTAGCEPVADADSSTPRS